MVSIQTLFILQAPLLQLQSMTGTTGGRGVGVGGTGIGTTGLQRLAWRQVWGRGRRWGLVHSQNSREEWKGPHGAGRQTEAPLFLRIKGKSLEPRLCALKFYSHRSATFPMRQQVGARGP